MTTDKAFQDWIEEQTWINWKDPKSVRKAFILFGDYVIKKYCNFKNNPVVSRSK